MPEMMRVVMIVPLLILRRLLDDYNFYDPHTATCACKIAVLLVTSLPGLDPSALIASISNGIVGKQQCGNGPKWAVTSTINFNAFDFLKACAGAA